MSIKKTIKKLINWKIYYGTKKIGYIGKNVSLPFKIFVSGSGENISIGNNTSIGTRATFMSTNANINIANNVVASHGLTIITGDHERRVGVFCNSIKEDNKNHSLNLDQDVIIEPDVWIGINVTILKGVTISRGSTICAGAVVNRSTLPYSISGGVPAKFIKFYWTIDEILKHEEKLYSQADRYTREELEQIFENKSL